VRRRRERHRHALSGGLRRLRRFVLWTDPLGRLQKRRSLGKIGRSCEEIAQAIGDGGPIELAAHVQEPRRQIVDAGGELSAITEARQADLRFPYLVRIEQRFDLAQDRVVQRPAHSLQWYPG
jgi:hypothetical protein